MERWLLVREQLPDAKMLSTSNDRELKGHFLALNALTARHADQGNWRELLASVHLLLPYEPALALWEKSAVTQLKEPIFALFNLPADTPGWLWVPIYLVVMFPMYQVLLLLFAALLGQWSFFWEKEKKMGRWLLSRLGFKE